MPSPISINIEVNDTFVHQHGGSIHEVIKSVEHVVTAIVNTIINVVDAHGTPNDERELITSMYLVNDNSESDKPRLKVFIGSIEHLHHSQEVHKTFIEHGLHKRYQTAIIKVVFQQKQPVVDTYPPRIVKGNADTELSSTLEDVLATLKIEDVERENSMAALRADINQLARHMPHDHHAGTPVTIWDTYRDRD